MKSTRPKVLHAVCGRPALWYEGRAAAAVRPDSIVVVVGHGGAQVEEAVRSWGLRPEPVFIDQGEPLGTAHAVMAAEEATAGADEVLALAGDDPLIWSSHVRELLRLHRRTKAAASILTADVHDPTGYSRIIREGDRLVGIVEEADASPEVRKIREISTLAYLFRREDLYKALPLVGRDNRQHEYYLPDVITILIQKGEAVSARRIDLGGWAGLNSRRTLASVAGVIRRRLIEGHMAKGVTFVDPGTAYVDVDVRIGRDTVIHPLTFLEGSTRVGVGCVIGPATRVVDSTVAQEAEVTFSVVKGSRIGRRVMVGPYAHIRPGTVLREGAKAGSFVEIKAADVGRKSKVPHLSYVGDASIGEGVNVGAGVVTVNYDGFAKHRTVIGDEAFVGSDTMLVAPVKVGKEAVTGAGSVITRDVPAGALAVERSEQRIVPGYAARKRARRQADGKDQAERTESTGRRSRTSRTKRGEGDSG